MLQIPTGTRVEKVLERQSAVDDQIPRRGTSWRAGIRARSEWCTDREGFVESERTRCRLHDDKVWRVLADSIARRLQIRSELTGHNGQAFLHVEFITLSFFYEQVYADGFSPREIEFMVVRVKFYFYFSHLLLVVSSEFIQIYSTRVRKFFIPTIPTLFSLLRD